MNPYPTSFSIVVETENLGRTQWKALWKCLESLELQVRPSVIDANEVVLVYEPLEGHLRQAELSQRFPWLKLLPTTEARYYYPCKNYGWRHTTGDIIVYLDSDCEAQDGWLREILRPFHERPQNATPEVPRPEHVGAVAGHTTVLPKRVHGLSMSIAYIFPQFPQQPIARTQAQYWSNNCAFRRELLERYPFMHNEQITRCPEHAELMVRHFETICYWSEAHAKHVPIPAGRFWYRWTTHGRDGALWNHVNRRWEPMWKMAARAVAWKTRNSYRQGREVLRREPWRVAALPFALPIVGAAMALYSLGAFSAVVRPPR